MEEMRLAMVLHHENGETRVLRPVLSDEERDRRYRLFQEAVARFLDNLEEGGAVNGTENIYIGAAQRGIQQDVSRG